MVATDAESGNVLELREMSLKSLKIAKMSLKINLGVFYLCSITLLKHFSEGNTFFSSKKYFS